MLPRPTRAGDGLFAGLAGLAGLGRVADLGLWSFGEQVAGLPSVDDPAIIDVHFHIWGDAVHHDLTLGVSAGQLVTGLLLDPGKIFSGLFGPDDLDSLKPHKPIELAIHQLFVALPDRCGKFFHLQRHVDRGDDLLQRLYCYRGSSTTAIESQPLPR